MSYSTDEQKSWEGLFTLPLRLKKRKVISTRVLTGAGFKVVQAGCRRRTCPCFFANGRLVEWTNASGHFRPATATSRGFGDTHSEPGRYELRRRGQELIVAFDESGTTLQIRDDSRSEVAKCDGTILLLGQLRIDLGTGSVEPGRDKSKPAANLLSAEWRVSGFEPAQLAELVLRRAAEQRTLTYNGVFNPAVDGIQRWHGEASSTDELVKTSVTEQPGTLLLEIEYNANGLYDPNTDSLAYDYS